MFSLAVASLCFLSWICCLFFSPSLSTFSLILFLCASVWLVVVVSSRCRSAVLAAVGFPSTLIIGRYAFTVTTPLVTHRQLQTADSRVTQMIASRVATQRVNKTAGCFVSSSSEKCRNSSIFLIFRQPGALFFFCAGVSGVSHYQCSCSTVSCRVGAPTSQRDEERPIFVSPSKLRKISLALRLKMKGHF